MIAVFSAVSSCDQEWSALARRAEGVWPAQDNLQPFHPLEPSGGVQSDFRRAGSKGLQARPADDRCHMEVLLRNDHHAHE